MPKPTKYQILSNLSERQIETDVATFMGWCVPSGSPPFRLLDIDEQVTGADKLYDHATVIYMQFKKSSGLKSVTSVAPSSRRRRSKLEDLREFRFANGLEENPSLYFQLRAKATHAADFQHNVLLRHNQLPNMRAIYVAPLTLDKDRYTAALFTSANRDLLDPFTYRFHLDIRSRLAVQQLAAVPFLREHISIPPHEIVSDHNHYYAYSEAGVDVSWHSPEVVSREPTRLSDFMLATLTNVIFDRERSTSKTALASLAVRIGREYGFEGTASPDDEPMQTFGEYGRWLKAAFEIRQFVLLSNSEEVLRMRSSW